MDNEMSDYFRAWASGATLNQIGKTALRLSKENPRELVSMINKMQRMGNYGLTEARIYLRTDDVVANLIKGGYGENVCGFIEKETIKVQQELLAMQGIRSGLTSNGLWHLVREIERGWPRTLRYSSRPQKTYRSGGDVLVASN